nr:MAG TPA: hypothetical protein [Caudoviricetes sp.]
MKTYKGTDKNMQCRGKQYVLGKKEVDDGAIRCGNKGYHSCEAPFDVLRHYPNINGNRFFEAEAGGEIDKKENDDTKLASSELTLKSEINFAGLVKAQIEYTRKKAKEGTAGGGWSNLIGGDRSNLIGGEWSNLIGGNRSNLAGGDSSLVVGRNRCNAKGGIHSVIVLTEWKYDDNGNYVPIDVKAEIVDGVRIKADTWYKLENGEFVEIINAE